MLKNAPTLAIVAVHTEENEPSKVLIQNIKIFILTIYSPDLERLVVDSDINLNHWEQFDVM